MLESKAYADTCRTCGGYHLIGYCPRATRAGALPQTALSFPEAEALAPRSVPLPAPVCLDLFRASQEELPL